MTKSKIEWTDYTLNPVKGKCPIACPYCYARKMYDRFKWNPEVRFEPNVYRNLPKKPNRIFVGSTIELFLFDDWVESILNRCQDYPQHTFQFLTKLPRRLIKFSPYPDNCWIGATATDYYSMFKAVRWLPEIKAKVKFISFEPLLESVAGVRLNLKGINWIIIGAQTNPYKPPKKEWVFEILKACSQAKIPVFMKDNLKPLLLDWQHLRQELPKCQNYQT